MAMIGVDCELLLDGTGYFVKAGSYTMKQPRIRKSTVRADGGTSYVDLGPGKREWRMTLLCKNDLLRYDGLSTGITGQQYRDAVRTSYLNSVGTTVLFTDPISSTVIAVHIDSYTEVVSDLHTQQVALSLTSSNGLSYEVTIELVEA